MRALKEGRLPPPGLLSPRSERRRRRWRKSQGYAFLFGAVIVLFLLYSTFVSPVALEHVEIYDRAKSAVVKADRRDAIPPGMSSRKVDQTSNYQAPLSGAATDDQNSQKGGPLHGPQMPVADDLKMKESAKESATSSGEKANTGDQLQIHKLPSESEKKSHKSYQVESPNLQTDLEAIFALLPDELNMRGLLRPIEEGGAERMRELGLRTRAYKKYFAAWEKLHLVEHEATGELHIRDNVLQQLYSTAGSDTHSISALSNTIRSYETFRAFLAKFARILFPFTSPYFADHMTFHAQFKNAGRGIVLTAGDDQAQYLLTTIYTFRKLGCDLPIEVMYLGDSDLGEDHRFELEALPGVTTRDISQMVDDEGWKLAGWAIKPFAILMSSFREVIFIDADSLFFKNPANLFEDPDYVKTGALFFRDRVILPESKRKWLLQVLPRPIPKLAKESTWWTGESGHYQESGVVVVDKWRHFISMLLVCRFNGSDRDGKDGKTGVYEMMHGDKETFWIGFLLAGDPSFVFHKGAVGILGTAQTSSINITSVETANDTNTDTDSSSDSKSSEIDLPTTTSTTDSRKDLPTEESKSEKEKEKVKTSTLAPREAPQQEHVTICSSQLLHLDVDGTPLWFNGWLLVSKFAEKPRRRFAPMPTFMIEPQPQKEGGAGAGAGGRGSGVGDPLVDFWQLTTDNMCCLTSYADSAFDLSEEDTEVLQMMRDRASEIGAV